jgi:hypothetical protein
MEQLRDAVGPQDVPPPPPQSVATAANPPFWRKIAGQPSVQLPLYRRTRTMPNGAIEETMWGPSAVQAIRWLVVLILGAIAIWKGGDASGAKEALLKWLLK